MNDPKKRTKRLNKSESDIIFSTLKNIQDNYKNHQESLQDILKLTNDNILEMRKESKETFSEVRKEQNLIRQEISNMYKCIVDIKSNSQIMEGELENKFIKIETEIIEIKKNHCSEEKRKIIDKLIEKYQGKLKNKKGIIKFFRELSLSNLKGFLSTILLILWPFIVINLDKIWKKIIDFFNNLHR